MEVQKQNQFYPIFNNSAFYPVNLSCILNTFYTSNQKYFTVSELTEVTQLSVTEIEDALKLLRSFGDIGEVRSIPSEPHFYLDIEGAKTQIKTSITQGKHLLNILETILEKRNNSNEELNAFIKNAIVFYSEILDFVSLKIEEHFNDSSNEK